MLVANAVVRARINEKIKNEAEVVLDAMGLTISDVVRMLMTRIANEKALPFDPLIPNEETIAAMREARRGKRPTFKAIDDLFEDLNAGTGSDRGVQT